MDGLATKPEPRTERGVNRCGVTRRRGTRSLFLFFILLSSFGCQAIPDPHALRVGSDLANPPFAFVNDAGEPAGKEPAMMRALAHRLNLELRWQRMEFSELIDAIEAGTIDVACATMGITAERSKRVRFSRPYFETEISVVVRVGATEPKSIDDLADLRVAASRGTTSEFAVREVLPNATWHFGAEKDGPVIDRLLGGEIDAAAMDGPNAVALANAHEQLRVLPEPLAAERYAIAIDPSHRRLAERIDRALAELKERGELPKVDTTP